MQSNASQVLSAATRRALLYILAAGLGAVLPYLSDGTTGFNWQLALKTFLAAAISAFLMRAVIEGGSDAIRAASGKVDTGDVAAYQPALSKDTPTAPPPGLPRNPAEFPRPPHNAQT